MSFGQQTGPPASDKQVQYLVALVQKAGYTDLREARHPLSLTQRQARGKFTRQEASELIERLLGEDSVDVAGAEPPRPPEPARPATPSGRTLRQLPLERLVAELERRGFKVIPEDTDSEATGDQDGSIP
ncbi:MAG: hypothetical protein M3337_06070 [Actinomycetota bacterium]|nr:hypothetical protein [Actinomycetota bacterium]